MTYIKSQYSFIFFIYLFFFIYLVSNVLLPQICLSFRLPVYQSNFMDDSGHMGNTGQLLNSRALDGCAVSINLDYDSCLSLSVLIKVITKFLIQHSVIASN